MLHRRIKIAIEISLILLLSAVNLSATDTKAPSSLRVMSYNIRAADYGLKNIISTIKQGNADIIALQEVDRLVRRTGRVDQPKRIAKTLGMYYVFRKHFSYQGGEFGLALISRYKIDQVERVRIRNSNLIILKARVHTPGQSIIVVVVHFHPTNPLDETATRRENNAARLREASRAFKLATTYNEPVLIMGDFNDPPGSQPYKLFAQQFQDSCRVAGANWNKTWPARFPITRIDYIWVSQHFRVLRCHTLKSSASDHLPVIAEIQPLTGTISP